MQTILAAMTQQALAKPEGDLGMLTTLVVGFASITAASMVLAGWLPLPKLKPPWKKRVSHYLYTVVLGLAAGGSGFVTVPHPGPLKALLTVALVSLLATLSAHGAVSATDAIKKVMKK